jgi:DNA-binding NarL/FixJ family response regulator
MRLIALSGYGHAEARRQAQEAGFDGYLVKPASSDEVARAIGA